MASSVNDTGIRLQLLNSILEEELEKYITDDNFCAQEKYDGVRRMVVVNHEEVFGVNKKGLSVEISKVMETELLDAKICANLDGEAFENYVMVFDDAEENLPYITRYKDLENLLKDKKLSTIKLAPVAWTTKEKRALLAKLKKDNAEGIVFKNIHSKYTEGRPNSGGDMLKYKFTESATCQVIGINKTKRSIALAMYTEEGKIVNVGNATVYPNQDMLKEGDFCEVKYLYAYKGGSLFQPILLSQREDVDVTDCNIFQLKYKRD